MVFLMQGILVRFYRNTLVERSKQTKNVKYAYLFCFEVLDLIFKAAGFEWRESGCSMCFFAGGESFGPKQRVVSSTNRNFESRQGPQTRTHIASPETVAASAISGCITDPRRLGART